MTNEGFSICYTDDDKDDRDLFTDAVTEISASLEILTQHNGDELIHLLKTPPPFVNLIFLDLNMPGKNGYEVLTEIRQADHTKGIPVIIFSTSDDAEAIRKSRQLGANLYIPKPWSFSLLKNAIEYTLSIDWKNFTPSGDEFVYRTN